MRKNKMIITILGCMCIFLIAALVIVPAAQAGEKTVKYKIAAPATKMELIPIPDMKGHAVGVLERRGVAIFENGETAAYHSMIIFDSIKGQGASWSGYGELSYADGSTTISKLQGTAPVVKGVKLVKGTGEYIKGTGRFEGIKGKCSANGKIVTPYTKDATKFDLVSDVTSTYTLPKK
jgi:hypothetical protein